MKKFLTLALVGALALGVSSAVFANICAFDPAPAATLLFPFVAFDYNAPTAGQTTLFAITNVSSEAQIVHVTVWNDLSTPVLDFNILLSGYDLVSINIRDILVDGTLPVTSSASYPNPGWEYAVWGDPPDHDGPVDNSSRWGTKWLTDGLGGDILPAPEGTQLLAARCTDANPYGYINGLNSNDIDTLYYYFTLSQTTPKWRTDCLGNYYQLPTWWEERDLTDQTWMYITADVVFQCNRLFPSQGAYWAVDMVQYQNVLIGDVFWLDDLSNFSEADNAVHIEADQQIAEVATITPAGLPVTFYYRYTGGIGAVDYREPLPTAWAFRYLGVGSAAIDTYIRAWKGSTFVAYIEDLVVDPDRVAPQELDAEDCLAYTYYAWDEDENVITVEDQPYSIPQGGQVYPNLLPLETQEVLADEFNTVPTNGNGWMLFIWPNSNFDGILNAPVLANNNYDWYQTWMGVRYAAFEKFSAFVSGAVMANYNCFSDQVLPVLGINYDYVVGDGVPDGNAQGYTESP